MRYILSFSGGKDSTELAHFLVENNYPFDEAVMFDTGWEFPQMYEHINKVRAFLESKGVMFTILKPRQNFDYLMFDKEVKEKAGGVHYGYSWCGAKKCRWGTTEKTAALDKYTQNSEGAIVYIGIAADETHRLEKERKSFKRFPLVENGITEAMCLDRCYARGYDWGGLYNHLDRVSCKYCANKNLRELRNIRLHYPEIWEELKERQTRTNLPYKGDGKSVFQLEARFLFEEERLAAGLSITNREFYTELKKRIKEV